LFATGVRAPGHASAAMIATPSEAAITAQRFNSAALQFDQ
jgi:hypothetical protein